MKAKFVGDPREGAEPKVPDTITVRGVTFERGKWAEVPDADAAKFEGNSHFETRGDAPDTTTEARLLTDAATGDVRVVPKKTAR
jgi:hypothetical protein